MKKTVGFSFLYDGAPFADAARLLSEKEEGNCWERTYEASQGLRLTNRATYYPDFGAVEWVNHFENLKDTPTGKLSQLWDGDFAIPLPKVAPHRHTATLPHPSEETRLVAPRGSVWAHDEFYCPVDRLVDNRYPNHIWMGETKHYSSRGGRSSDGQAPFFHVHYQGQGAFVAIGWTGQWHCEFTREEEAIRVRIGIEDAAFRILPGEKFRTASVVVMPYQGDMETGVNLWRRLIKTHFSLIGQPGRDAQGPLCACIWGGMKTSSVLDRIRVIKENELPYEYVWMDAGWYGESTKATPDEFEGDWFEHTGDWRVSPLVHPGGLKDVVREIHDAGMKFVLWFEPERVKKHTPTAAAHPEWFFHEEGRSDALLNLGHPEAWEDCYRTLSTLFREVGVDFYRQDFNIAPLSLWRAADTEDRRGMSEILHINGLYRLWDTLLAEFPHLMIDNCASGGRRIDIEMLRRSIPLWRSDYQCPANHPPVGVQNHNQNFNGWMPYSGTGSGRLYDLYRLRSAYSAALTTNYTFSERSAFGKDPEEIALLSFALREYLSIRPYLSEDFYPLTQPSDATDIWCATQFHRPEDGSGILQVFRREDSPYESAVFALRGVLAEKNYLLEDTDGVISVIRSGKELLEGFSITLPEKRSARIYRYREV